MATTTTRLSLRKPADDDTVDVKTDISDNMDTIDNNIGFERRTDFPTSPYTGKTVMRSDQGDRCYVYDGTNWEEVLVVSSIMAPQTSTSLSERNTTSQTYTNLEPTVELTFVAPPSGAIYVTVIAALESVSPASAGASYEIRETNVSGSVVIAAADSRGVSVQDDHFVRCSSRSVATGLTAGNTYYIRLLCRTSANTATFFQRGLLIEPVLKI